MLTNLAHLEFMRLVKSRYLKATLAIAVLVLVFIFMVFHFFTASIIAENLKQLVNVNRIHQLGMTVPSVNILWGVEVIAIVFVICDYYKYRLYINIQNYISSSLKFCVSEFAGIFLFSLLLAVIPLVAILFSATFDKENYYTNPLHIPALYIGIVLVLFISSLPAVFFAKLFKRVWPALIVFFVNNLLSSFLSGFLTGYLEVDSSTPGVIQSTINQESIATFALNILFPGNTILQVTNGNYDVSSPFYSLPLTIFNYCAIIIMWLCACSLITRKRVSR